MIQESRVLIEQIIRVYEDEEEMRADRDAMKENGYSSGLMSKFKAKPFKILFTKTIED